MSSSLPETETTTKQQSDFTPDQRRPPNFDASPGARAKQDPTEDVAAARRNSLRTKIYIACALLVSLCLISSAIGWFGQRTLLSNFERYEQTDLLAFDVLEIERGVPVLKAAVDRFLFTGAESQHRSADQTLDELVEKIEQQQQATTDEELKTLLERMLEHLTTFDSQFNEAAAERAIRTDLVSNALPAAADRVFASITQAATPPTATSGSNVSSRQEVRRVFTSAYAHLLQYFVDPRYLEFEAAVADIEQSLRLANTFAESATETTGTDEPSEAERWRNVAEAIEAFERLALRSFQATRSYLYYSNVVLAGEISEFVYYSSRIKSYVDQQQRESREARDIAAKRTGTLTIISSLLAVVLAVVLAVGLSYLIIPPLADLTRTFRSLASGATIDDIPAAKRHDEIGRMALAAKVFSARNRETRELLDYSRGLAASLEVKARELEASNQELDDFAYVASHDLKAPLRGIDNLAEWVDEDCRELIPEESRTHLTQMRARVRKMKSLLDDLLDYSRIGRIGHSPEEVDVYDLVSSVIDILDRSSGVHVSIEGTLPTLTTVRTPLQQIFLNLLTNSMKYNDKGEAGQIVVSCVDNVDSFLFTVSDNGIGIPPKHHERVFQMYQRVATDRADGTGMGLSLVRKNVEKYGGTIDLESEEGKGAKFTFAWPKQISDEVQS